MQDSKEEKNEFGFTNSAENELLFNKATEHLQERENSEAIELFDKILLTEPDNINALNGKGSGLMQSNRMDEAEKVFNQSLSIKDNEMAYVNKAIIYGNFGNYEKAIKCCDKVIELEPELGDIIHAMRADFIEKMNKTNPSNSENYNSEAQKLINKANALKDENKLWDAWDNYNQAINADADCENKVYFYINELKLKLIKEFLFFNVTMDDDFNPQNEVCMLKLNVMKAMFIDNKFTKALIDTKQILTLQEDDIDAMNYMGAISFYFDEVDEAIKHFEAVAEKGSDIYVFFAKFNKALVLRRKFMITRDFNCMVQALDIFDEMLKNPELYDKVKPHQRELLDKIQDIMGVPLF